ncbi:hypothetical protein LTR36_003857 [Oleoguttula mirabilis]|uniref:Uncharacterized protein n=1 Tax=Oleoguttula mirabilis TaxID=1507867 RepID=A0AAV9JIQ3_9PEZI|nr:hypothetical protein LTR36_003857 [Oleoguttula mirabilis]
MASAPINTDNVGLGISGADGSADNHHEPEQHESPEQGSSHDNKEESEWQNVDLGASSAPAVADDKLQRSERLVLPEEGEEQFDNSTHIPQTAEERESFDYHSSPEQCDLETVSHFSSSSDEDEDDDESQQATFNGVDTTVAVLTRESGEVDGPIRNDGTNLLAEGDNQAGTGGTVRILETAVARVANGPRSPPRDWNADDIAQVNREQALGFYYGNRPASCVTSDRAGDLILRNDKRWVRDRRLWMYEDRWERQKPLPPSRLRKVRSADDISPATSPKAVQVASTSLWVPSSGSSWADEDDEDVDGTVVEYLRRASIAGPISSVDTSSGSNADAQENGSMAIYDVASESGNDEDEETANTSGDNCSEVPAQEEDAHDGPMPIVRPCTPTPLDTNIPPQRLPDRNGPHEVPVAGGGNVTKAAPECAGSLDGEANGEDATSPTPSSASSMESTTNMTQSEGLRAADEYIEDTRHDLVKQRSTFKDRYAGAKYVNGIKEDPQARIELLEAKVHLYREMRDKAKAEAQQRKEQAERSLRTMLEKYNELVDKYNFDIDQLNEGHEEEYAKLNAKHEDECAMLKERLESLLEQLQQAEDNEVAARKKYEEEKKHAERRIKQWKAFADSNAELAECERRRRETEMMDATTDTDDIPGQEPTERTETDSPVTQPAAADGSTADVYSEQCTQTEQGTQIEQGTQTEQGTQNERGTQTDSSPTPREPLSPRGPKRQPAPLLPDDAVRWPAKTRTQTASHIAGWVNAAYRQPVEPLTAPQVEQFLGENGETSFDQLVSIMEHVGYVFRPDHFAQDIEQYTRGLDNTNLEAMHFYRRTDPFREHPSRRLLEEIESVRSDLADSRAEYRRGVGGALNSMNNQLASVNTQLERREAELAAGRIDLADCHKHGEELEEQKTELEATLNELTERLCDSDSEKPSPNSMPTIDENELEELKEQLAACKEASRRLALSAAADRQQFKTIEKLYYAQHADDQGLQAQLQQCHEHGKQLELRNGELEAELFGLNAQIKDFEAKVGILSQSLEAAKTAHETAKLAAEESQNKPAVDVEKIRLQRELDELQAKQSKHVDMLQAARTHIENLSAVAEQTATENAKLRTHIAQADTTTGDRVPDTPFLRVPPRTTRQQAQPGARPSELLSPLPRSPGAGGLPFTPATPFFMRSQPAHWTGREARIGNSEAYKRTREALRKKREAEEQKQAELWKFRQEAYKRLCGCEEVPYVPLEKRRELLRKSANVA